MSDLVQRLRATPNWKREDFGTWKDGCSVYDRAPFEAAGEIERLRGMLIRATGLLERRDNEVSALRAALRDDGYNDASIDMIVAAHVSSEE